MPTPIQEIIRRRVIQLWITGESRDNIASDLEIGAGTVSGIVSDFKKNVQGSDIDTVREFAVEAKKQGFTLSTLAPHIRLHNFIKKSGASEEKVESFITNVSSNNYPPEKAVELVNQLDEISKTEPIPLDQIPSYIQAKLEEKKKIDEEIKEAVAILQSKNVNIETINEHLKLKEELDRHAVSMQDIDKLLKLLSNAKRYGFDDKVFADRLFNMLELEWKERELKDKCKKLSKKISKYKDLVPLTEAIAAWGIRIDELLALKVGINQAAKHYNLLPLAATLRLIDDIKKYNKIDGLKKELSALYLQKFTINEFCSRHNQALTTLARLQIHGITEDQIISMSNFLESKIDVKSISNPHFHISRIL